MADDLPVDCDELNGASVGVNFFGTSISSSGDGAREAENQSSLLWENPFVKFHNRERGYVLCEVTPDAWRSDYPTVEYVTHNGAPNDTRVSFVVESGRSKLEKA